MTTTVEKEAETSEGELLREVPIENIIANPYQPRQALEEDELDSLAASIRSVGLIHPPIVRQTGDERYELIAGERRFRACVRLGMQQIPVHVKKSTHSHSAEAALIENLQRVDLNPMEVARAFQRLIKQFGLKQEKLAERVGKKRSTVANYLRLLTLSKAIQEAVEGGEISMGHAKAILSLNKDADREELLKKIIDEGLSVRSAEHWVSEVSAPPKAKKKPKAFTPDLFFFQDLEDRLQNHLGTKVKLTRQGKSGRITIDYHSLDDLDRLIEVIGLEEAL